MNPDETKNTKMKILTLERDCGTHNIGFQFGEVEGNDPDAEGFDLIEDGSLNIDTDEDGEPLDWEASEKLTEMSSEADAIFEVDNIAAHTNSYRVK